MTLISKQFAAELSDKAMRNAYLEAQTRTKIAQQIRTLRTQRNLSQAQLGALLGKPQANIARLEDRDVARYTLSTLFELAEAFDVGLVVEFSSYSEFIKHTCDLSPDNLGVPNFSGEELEPLFTEETDQAENFGKSSNYLTTSSIVQADAYNRLIPLSIGPLPNEIWPARVPSSVEAVSLASLYAVGYPLIPERTGHREGRTPDPAKLDVRMGADGRGSNGTAFALQIISSGNMS